MRFLMLFPAIVVAGAWQTPVMAQSNVDPAHAFAWTENTGWTNWRGGNGGVRVHATFLSGYVWCEDVGWINLGDGRPADGIEYSNVDDSDFGVNIEPATGNLFGKAWGENIGWVSFDTLASLGPYGQQARFVHTLPPYWSGRFRGYAWGENVGWINLDHANNYVAIVPADCRDPFADADGDSDVDQSDFAVFQVCLTSSGWPSPLGCTCFDRPETGLPFGDNDVDRDDLARFEACVSGSGIPASAACDG
jgi:hypothetical protein